MVLCRANVYISACVLSVRAWSRGGDEIRGGGGGVGWEENICENVNVLACVCVYVCARVHVFTCSRVLVCERARPRCKCDSQ